jgi:hypothetical protein
VERSEAPILENRQVDDQLPTAPAAPLPCPVHPPFSPGRSTGPVPVDRTIGHYGNQQTVSSGREGCEQMKEMKEVKEICPTTRHLPFLPSPFSPLNSFSPQERKYHPVSNRKNRMLLTN